MSIAGEVLSRIPELARQFAAATPFRYVVIDDFLDPALCRRLLEEFPAFEDRYAVNEMGEVGQKAVREDVHELSPAFRELDAQVSGSAFLDFVSRVTGIPDLLYDPDYVGGGTHENRHGQALDAHVDFNYHPGRRWHRRLNLIVYLNPQWQPGWGGNLELRGDPWKPGPPEAAIAPDFNRCVIFETTESSWHGFSEIRLPEAERHRSRKSFAIYLYTTQREAAETAPPHATVYVPEGMPTDLQPGRMLTPEDLAMLAQRFARMQGQLRFLYEREKAFAARIDGLEADLAEARSMLRLPIEGFAVQPQAPEGVWPDLWLGREASFVVQATRASRRLRLTLWSPPQIESGQALVAEVAGKRVDTRIGPGRIGRLDLPLALDEGEAATVVLRAQAQFVPAECAARARTLARSRAAWSASSWTESPEPPARRRSCRATCRTIGAVLPKAVAWATVGAAVQRPVHGREQDSSVGHRRSRPAGTVPGAGTR